MHSNKWGKVSTCNREREAAHTLEESVTCGSHSPVGGEAEILAAAAFHVKPVKPAGRTEDPE